MNILPEDKPYGVAPAILIDCATQLAEFESFSFDDFCQALGARARECKPVLDNMISDGTITVRTEECDKFYCTPRLCQLALARIGQGLARADADILLEKIISKAKEINDSPVEFSQAVECLVVFGSYLGDKSVLGDLDMGVELIDRSEKQRDNKPFGGQQIREWKSQCRKTYAAIRMRKPNQISLHSLDEVIQLGTPYRIVFGELPATK